MLLRDAFFGVQPDLDEPEPTHWRRCISHRAVETFSKVQVIDLNCRLQNSFTATLDIYIQDCLRKLEYCDEVLYFLQCN